MGFSRVLTLFFIVFSAISCAVASTPNDGGDVNYVLSDITPYRENVSTDKFFNGTTYVLEEHQDMDSFLDYEFGRLRNSYNINTVTIYGLESFGESTWNALFKALKKYDMQLVVRIEGYDSDFAFRATDADKMINRCIQLIEYCSRSENKERIAYFALNVPVDDPVVQKNAGGLNTSKWKNAQLVFVKAFVEKMRKTTSALGFSDAAMYLSVFYGWDNTFDIPSYAEAGADGYFINNYSYPKRGVPNSSMSDGDIINADRLSISMKRYKSQYENSPVVMEWGFHTVDYNNGMVPNQTAGVVQDLETKQRAMKATVDFYQDNWEMVRGCLYFGFNLLKEEGNPPSVMDWCLYYPSQEGTRAIDAMLEGATLTSSFGEFVALLDKDGSSFSISSIYTLQMISIEYRSTEPATIEIRTDGRLKKTVVLPASEEFVSVGIPVVGAEGQKLSLIKISGGALMVKTVKTYPVLEAELGENAKVETFKSNSNTSFSCVNDKSSPLIFRGTRGGETLTICYRAESSVFLNIQINSKKASVLLPESESFVEKTFNVEIPKDANIAFFTDGKERLDVDYVYMAGIPGVAR